MFRTPRLFFFAFVTALVAATNPVIPSLAIAQQPGAAADLAALLEAEWEFRLREDPLFATSVGEHQYNDRLPSMTPEDQTRRAEMRRDFLHRLEAIDREVLGDDDRVSYDMMALELRDAIAEFEFRSYELPLTADWGFHMGFARLPAEVPLLTADDYRNYIARLEAFPTYLGQQIAVIRSGLARGFTVPQVTLLGYESTVSAHVVDDVETSVFWRPFASFPSTVPTAEHETLRGAGRRAVTEAVIPGYRTFLAFLTDEYIPGARVSLGAHQLPDGEAYYSYLINHFTTLERTPQQIHDLGLSEVSRIRAEMETIIAEVEFDGSFAEFLEFLRTDPRFYAQTPEELLKEASYLAKRMDGKLPSLFGTLPRQPYTVDPVPEEIAPKYTAGRYIGAPRGGTQPGAYWVNTYQLESRPLYALPALTLHEAVPGHHLQNARSAELDDLPAFRRAAYINAFGEGWGLYSEWLGIEAGIYTDPYSRFGRLTYEMWRACRLVVDTGVHAMGWTRQEAIDYLASNTALSIHEVTTEIDRYISWPGQALAYKMGELTLRRLRGEAEEALGTAFDVREFHDVVLGSGTLPMTVLEEQVRRYIVAKRAKLSS